MNGGSTPDWRRIKSSPASAWITPAQACNRIPGMTLEALASLRESRNGPRYYKPNLHTILYLEYEVDQWADEMRAKLEAVTK